MLKVMAALAAIGIAGACGAARAPFQAPFPPAEMRAARGNPGWTIDRQTGCWIWNPRPTGKESVRWNGVCPEGPAEGEGVLEWVDGEKNTTHYDGTVRNGRYEGRGVLTEPDGTRYEGTFSDNRLQGRGVTTFANGARYEGEFRDHNRPAEA